MRKTKSHSDGLAVKGFFRVQLTEEGKGVVGDSGWTQNQVTNLGIRQYVVDWLCSGAGKSITYMALGTGTVVGAAATALIGELTHSTSGRAAVSSSIIASGTAQFTGAFASANSFVTATANISCIGLYNTSTTNVGTLFAGNTFASSSCATNQSVNAFLKKIGTFISNGEKKIPQIRWISLFTETIPSQPCY
jgi:hypothetical protein